MDFAEKIVLVHIFTLKSLSFLCFGLFFVHMVVIMYTPESCFWAHVYIFTTEKNDLLTFCCLLYQHFSA